MKPPRKPTDEAKATNLPPDAEIAPSEALGHATVNPESPVTLVELGINYGRFAAVFQPLGKRFVSAYFEDLPITAEGSTIDEARANLKLAARRFFDATRREQESIRAGNGPVTREILVVELP